MSNVAEERKTVSIPKWQAIDWAAKALSVAAYACKAAGLDDIALEVEALHQGVTRRRDRA